MPSVVAPCQTSSGENACTCISGSADFTRAQNVEISLAREARMNAALQTHLRRTALARLERAAHDLGDIEQVRPLRALVLARALRERAERAAVAADVGVIDVAVDDVSGDGAVRLRAQRIRRLADPAEIGAPRIEECRERLPVDVLSAVLHELIEKLRRRRRTGAPLGCREARRQIGTAARAPAILARERCSVALLENRAAHGRVEPLAGDLAYAG